MGAIYLGSFDWQVERAALQATILPVDQADKEWGPGTGGIHWHFDIKAKKRTFKGEAMAPYVYAAFTMPGRSWMGLAGQKFTWPDNNQGRPRMCIYTHDEILDAEIRFGTRTGSEFGFGLSGRYPFLGNDDLQVTAKIPFLGVQVWADDPVEAWHRLGQHLDGREFKPEPVRAFGKSGLAGRSYFGFEPLPKESCA